MIDAERCVVEVRENVTEALIEHHGRVYVSPRQDRDQALELVAVLAGQPTSANGGSEHVWRQAVANRSAASRCDARSRHDRMSPEPIVTRYGSLTRVKPVHAVRRSGACLDWLHGTTRN